MLYDLAADPLERNDLAGDLSARADDLEEMLLEYLESVGAEEAAGR